MTAVASVFKAELKKLTRPRALAFTAAGVLVAAIVAASVAIFAADSAAAGGPPDRGTTIEALESAGGGTEAFALGMSFTGFFAFVVLTANWAGEFSQGTFRTLLMKQPRRIDLMAGKLAGLLAFAAAVLVAGEFLTWVLSLVMAPMEDISTSEWFTGRALVEGLEDYGNAIILITAWSAFAMMIAVLIRSTPLALGAGIAWAGPFEHLTQEAWNSASGIYPGLLLEALAVGGTQDVSYARALGLLAAYVAAAVFIATRSFMRRDVTG